MPIESNIKKQHSLIIGLLLSFPVSYPAPPSYIVSFVIFLSVLVYFKEYKPSHTTYFVFAAIAAAIISNTFATNFEQISFTRSLYTSFYFSFLLFGAMVPFKDLALRGVAMGCNIVALLVIIAAIYLGLWQHGLLLFSVPEYRLWGADLFPDWPNFLAFFIGLGMLLNYLLYRQPLWTGICFVAGVLTTSRTPFIAAGLIGIHAFLQLKDRRVQVRLAIAGFGSMAAVFILLKDLLRERLLVVSDREEIYQFALNMFLQNPISGHGSILLDSSVGHYGHASFHNSYLDIMVRHGIIGLSTFLVLIYPIGIFKNKDTKKYIPIVLFFLVGSFFQNFFKHPHIIMIYSIILSQLADNKEFAEND